MLLGSTLQELEMNLATATKSQFNWHCAGSAEEQNSLFGKLSQVVIPNLTAGGIPFLGHIGRWYANYAAPRPGIHVLIPPNPSHAIAFPTALEALRWAIDLAARDGQAPLQLGDILARYGLIPETCSQPIYTLSAGERALVVLAKASVLFPTADSAIVCNPSRWLHSSRRHLVTSTLNRLGNAQENGHFIYLRGEEDMNGDAAGANSTNEVVKALRAAPWRLHLQTPTIHFPATDFPLAAPGKKIVYVAKQEQIEAQSPTLIVGDNGVGKSTGGFFLLKNNFVRRQRNS